MLKCLIAFILGWLASRMMGNGFRVSASSASNASSTRLTLDDLKESIKDDEKVTRNTMVN